MKSVLLLTLTVITLSLAACDQQVDVPPLPPARPTQREQAINLAHKIVSDPSNWKNNTAVLTDLGDLAQDMGVADTDEFRQFDTDAQDLIRFGTVWISNVNEGMKTRLHGELEHITSQTDATIHVAGKSEASADVDSAQDSTKVQVDAERAILTTIESLRAAQADEFGKIFARAQTSYRALRQLLKSPRPHKHK